MFKIKSVEVKNQGGPEITSARVFEVMPGLYCVEANTKEKRPQYAFGSFCAVETQGQRQGRCIYFLNDAGMSRVQIETEGDCLQLVEGQRYGLDLFYLDVEIARKMKMVMEAKCFT